MNILSRKDIAFNHEGVASDFLAECLILQTKANQFILKYTDRLIGHEFKSGIHLHPYHKYWHFDIMLSPVKGLREKGVVVSFEYSFYGPTFPFDFINEIMDQLLKGGDIIELHERYKQRRGA